MIPNFLGSKVRTHLVVKHTSKWHRLIAREHKGFVMQARTQPAFAQSINHAFALSPLPTENRICTLKQVKKGINKQNPSTRPALAFQWHETTVPVVTSLSGSIIHCMKWFQRRRSPFQLFYISVTRVRMPRDGRVRTFITSYFGGPCAARDVADATG